MFESTKIKAANRHDSRARFRRASGRHPVLEIHGVPLRARPPASCGLRHGVPLVAPPAELAAPTLRWSSPACAPTAEFRRVPYPEEGPEGAYSYGEYGRLLSVSQTYVREGRYRASARRDPADRCLPAFTARTTFRAPCRRLREWPDWSPAAPCARAQLPAAPCRSWPPCTAPTSCRSCPATHHR
jgi:hypothetical protein